MESAVVTEVAPSILPLTFKLILYPYTFPPLHTLPSFIPADHEIAHQWSGSPHSWDSIYQHQKKPQRLLVKLLTNKFNTKGGALYRYRKGQNIAPSKFHFGGSSLKVLHKACDTPLRDVHTCTIHVSNMSARDSVILLVSATNMLKIYLFTSSLVHFRRIEPKTAWYCEDLRCFCKSLPGAVRISLSRSANTVERKI